MKAIEKGSERGWKPARKRKAALAVKINQLERKILNSVPYDNWSAGDGSAAPKPKRGI